MSKAFIHVMGGCPDKEKDSISPNGILIQSGGLNFLVDPGMGHETLPNGKQRALHIDLRVLRAVGHIDYVLLTHLHMDHAGLIPWVMKVFPMAELVCTAPTLRVARHSWYDAAYIGKRYYPGVVPFCTSLYQEMQRRAVLLESPGWVRLKRGASVYMDSNGHTRGSGYIALEVSGRRIVFSGDVSTNDMPTIRGMREGNVPAEIRGADLMFLESTLGDRETPDRKSEIARMNEAVLQTMRSGGNVLAATLGVERAQDVAIDLVRTGLTPSIDGRLACFVWNSYLDPESFWSENDLAIDPPVAGHVKLLAGYNRDEHEQLARRDRPMLIVSSGGSLQGGWSVFWAERWLPSAKNGVFLCNYQFKGTPGRFLEERGTGCTLSLQGKKILVRAKIMRIEASAHVGGDELLRVMGWFAPRRVVAYHGEHHARAALSGKSGGKIELPVDGDVVELE